jgi:GDP-L-fucose synthase
MPTNLYGPNDNFDLETSHVLPAMIRKFHEAKVRDNAPVTLWGTGLPMREFLHVDDLASAVVVALETVLPESMYNVGCGEDVSIMELATIVQEVVGHSGEILWDSTKPDGTPRKLMDVSRMNGLGWKPNIGLRDGIKSTYESFLRSQG